MVKTKSKRKNVNKVAPNNEEEIMCRTGRNGENVLTGIKVNNSYVTSKFLRGKIPT